MAQWEQLVTEGHVRAAIFRTAVKFVVAIAVCLIVVGLIGVRFVPGVQVPSRIVQAKQELVIARQRALMAFIADKGVPPVTLPADAAKAIQRDQVSGLIEQLLDSLGKSNTLPQEIKSLDPKVFWSGDWTPGAVAAVTGGRSILIGFYVNEAAVRPRVGSAPVEQPTPRIARVFGLFRQSKVSWSFYCLSVPRAGLCGRGEMINPLSIPATMIELMPDARP
jgi:hypothetical protein